MRVFGFLFILLGTLGLLGSLLGNLPGGVIPESGIAVPGLDRAVSLGLAAPQGSLLFPSGLLFLTGWMLVGFAAVRAAIDRLGRAVRAQAPQATIPVLAGSGIIAGGLTVGARVHHASFGAGQVRALSGDIATVAFDDRGKPMLISTAYLTRA